METLRRYVPPPRWPSPAERAALARVVERTPRRTWGDRLRGWWLR